MGPVSCLAQLTAATGPHAVGTASAALARLLDDPANASDEQWLTAVANAAARQLDRPDAPDAPLLALLSRAAAGLRAASARGAADADALQYGAIRRLVAREAHAAALGQCWELLESLGASRPAPPAGRGADARQRQQREVLLAGAVINLVVCTAEAGAPEPAACGRLAAAVEALLGSLRRALVGRGSGGLVGGEWGVALHSMSVSKPSGTRAPRLAQRNASCAFLPKWPATV
jgi:hypothetical protein